MPCSPPVRCLIGSKLSPEAVAGDNRLPTNHPTLGADPVVVLILPRC